MSVSTERDLKQLYGRSIDDDCHRDLLHELSKRLDTIRRCRQYIVNADGDAVIIAFWRSIRQQEIDNAKLIQDLLFALKGQQDAQIESDMLRDAAEVVADIPLNFSTVGTLRITVET